MCWSLANSAPDGGLGHCPQHHAQRGAAWLALAVNPLRWPSLLLYGLIQLYRVGLSRWTFPSCRFTPTCSRYALDAVRRYGVLRGGGLACWRVLRCNPFTRGGYDPLQ